MLIARLSQCVRCAKPGQNSFVVNLLILVGFDVFNVRKEYTGMEEIYSRVNSRSAQ